MLGLASVGYALDDAEDVQLSSWEGDGNLDGWNWQAWNSNSIVSWSTTTGVTDLYYSLAVDVNYPGAQTGNNWWYMPILNYQFIGEEARNYFWGNDTFSLDVATLMSEWLPNTDAGWIYDTGVQLVVIAGDGVYEGRRMGVYLDWREWQPDLTDYSATLSWNYQAQKNMLLSWGLNHDPYQGWIEFVLLARTPTFESPPDGTGDPGKYYFDNAWLTGTPEPTTIALLGLGSLALLRKKSQHKPPFGGYKATSH